jgi:hypothetical protein
MNYGTEGVMWEEMLFIKNRGSSSLSYKNKLYKEIKKANYQKKWPHTHTDSSTFNYKKTQIPRKAGHMHTRPMLAGHPLIHTTGPSCLLHSFNRKKSDNILRYLKQITSHNLH